MKPVQLLMSVFAATFVSSWSNMKYLFNVKHTILGHEKSVFKTTIISSLNGCVKECEAVTSCRLVNYRRRGNSCMLVHFIGLDAFKPEMVYRENRTAGIISWTKTDADVCTDCDPSLSCKNESDSGTCGIYACRNPQYWNQLRLLGNMYTVSSKLVYQCLDHMSDYRFFYPIKCDTNGLWTKPETESWSEMHAGNWKEIHDGNWTEVHDGDWTALYKLCGYTKFTINTTSHELSFMYKIGHKKRNKTIAELKCRMDGARLVSFLTIEMRDFFTAIKDDCNRTWIDAERGDNQTWFSSTGEEIPTDTNLWENQTDDKNKSCVRLRVTNKENPAKTIKMSARSCGKKISYICEITL